MYMLKIILKLLNPLNYIRAYLYHRRSGRYDKSSYDLELFLYSKVLENDMLHYGYFEDINISSDTISIREVEDAQVRYAENVIDKINNVKAPILDVGCGMGGMAGLLLQRGFIVEALTPDENQKSYIDNKYKDLVCHRCKFEDFNSARKFGTIINSESLQYISLDKAFENAEILILPGGRWIILDYFRLCRDTIANSGHLLEDFIREIEEHGWNIVYKKDITQNILPTIKVIDMYAKRFLLPMVHYAFENLRFKKPWLYYLTADIRDLINNKIDRELASIDPERFIKEKRYMFYVLEKR